MGSQRVGHDWATEHTKICYHTYLIHNPRYSMEWVTKPLKMSNCITEKIMKVWGRCSDDEYLGSAMLCWFPRWCTGKESACQCRRCKRCGSPPGSERSPEGGNGNPLQYPCLENPVDRGGYSPWGCKESKMPDRLSIHTCALLLNKFQIVSEDVSWLYT